MKNHHYWGEIFESWAGFSSDVTFSHSFFESEEIDIFLGEEFDEEGEEVTEPPNGSELDEYAKTYKTFIENIETIMERLQKASFEHYLKFYSHYYENADKTGEEPLQIDDIEKHNSYIKDVLEMRVLSGQVIKIAFTYPLDREHGMEVKFVGLQPVDTGGIAET